MALGVVYLVPHVCAPVVDEQGEPSTGELDRKVCIAVYGRICYVCIYLAMYLPYIHLLKL